MKKTKFLLMLLTLMLTSMTSLAQKRTLTGHVVDNTGEAVIGASVVQKGTSNGVITNYDGDFRIDVEPGAVLTISYMGYTSQDVRATFPSVSVTLQPDEQLLDEVENKTVYPDATQQEHGLMSTSDKTKLDTIMVITSEEIELLFINP